MSVEQEPSWEWYGTFLSVMREGSLSAASRRLRVAQPTVRRRIAALEQALGHTLFSRSPNGLLPTAAAHRILPFAKTMEATSRSLVRTLSGESGGARGVVRVAASEILGVELLPPLILPLRESHPQLQLELMLSDGLADVARREADIAIRLTPPKGATLVARKLGVVHLGLFAAPAYLASRSMPQSLDALREHFLVGQDTSLQLIESLAALGVPLRREDFAFRTDHNLAYLAAIRHGLGIGVTDMAVARKWQLTRVLPEVALPLALWLVAHEDLKDVARIRIVLDHLAQALRDHVIEG